MEKAGEFFCHCPYHERYLSNITVVRESCEKIAWKKISGLNGIRIRAVQCSLSRRSPAFQVYEI